MNQRLDCMLVSKCKLYCGCAFMRRIEGHWPFLIMFIEFLVFQKYKHIFVFARIFVWKKQMCNKKVTRNRPAEKMHLWIAKSFPIQLFINCCQFLHSNIEMIVLKSCRPLLYVCKSHRALTVTNIAFKKPSGYLVF